VANSGSGSVTPIDTATDTADSPITVGSGPNAIAITPNGQTVYVVNSGSGSVTPIDTATNTAGAPITVGSSPEGIAITPDQAPRASFTVTPAPPGSPSGFDASGSTAPSSPIATYTWSFGDGNSATTDVPTTSHTYADAGTYTVTLTLTDTAGTSTARVFTGQTVSLNGGPGAKTSQTVNISSEGPSVPLGASGSVPEN
jgi:YVTN family beta-propeller protein